MRKFMACICAAALSVGLFACGGASSSTSSPAQKSSLLDEQTISVDYKGWKLDFKTPRVVWSEQEQTDLLVINATATNNTGKEAKFADINNVNAVPDTSNKALDIYGEDELTLSGNAANANAATDAPAGADASLTDVTVVQNVKAGEETTAPNESIDLVYSWKLDSNYGTIRVDIQGYSASKDDTSVVYTDIAPTEEFSAYQATQDILNDARRNTSAVSIKGATVYKPYDWYLGNITLSSVDAKMTSDAERFLRVQFITTAESARDRAVKYAGNYNLTEADVQTAAIGGVEWFYFRPSSAQFQAYAQATNGIVNVGSTSYSWEDADPILNNVTIH